MYDPGEHGLGTPVPDGQYDPTGQTFPKGSISYLQYQHDINHKHTINFYLQNCFTVLIIIIIVIIKLSLAGAIHS